ADMGEPPQPPSFEGLLVAELELGAAALGDITLDVADVRSDTRVEIDGRAWLPGAAGPAAIEDGQLRIPLGGAMVVGTHELALSHQAGSVELRSDTVSIEVVASEPDPLSASLGADPIDAGDRLIAHGQGGAAVLGVVDDIAGLVRVRAGAWSAEGFELELPGLVAGGGIGGRAG
ncbi:hypothetical protein, partial [Enhygromyxa salina]|uniref:hypothetical protein n=1 Tax=Enhygromyxa salina TaxID=215803 RepID=UPI0015E60DAC